MTGWLLIILSLLQTSSSKQDPQTGEELIRDMYHRYAGHWYQNLTFNQTTDFYRNDSFRASQIWYEAIAFPGRFRIDFGSPDSGNAVIFRGDSVYNFRGGRIQSVRPSDEHLTFLLGGMYFDSLDETIRQFHKFGYDLGKLHADRWKGKAVWVVGAEKGNLESNQLWFDREHFFLVRMLDQHAGRKEEGLFDEHIPVGGGWTETQVHFYINGKLVQVEQYHDCRPNVPLPDELFDPKEFHKPSWISQKP
jgi:hypothetical protein